VDAGCEAADDLVVGLALPGVDEGVLEAKGLQAVKQHHIEVVLRAGLRTQQCVDAAYLFLQGASGRCVLNTFSKYG